LVHLNTEQYFSHFSDTDEKPEIDMSGWQKIQSPHNNFKAKVLRWPFSCCWTLGRLSLEMLFHKPDILFVPAHTLPLLHPKKTINTVHDISFARDKDICRKESVGPKQRSLKKLFNVLVKLVTYGRHEATLIDYLDWSACFSLKRAKKVITVSEFSKKEIMDVYKIKEDKIRVVHNGYNKFLYKKIDNQEEIDKVLKKYGISKPYVLYVGRLEKKKNISCLIEAFARLDFVDDSIKHKLVLVGNADFGYDEINYNIQEFGLNKKVVMPGWIDEEDMPYVYSGADAFVFPSKYEGFGIPLLQAMACGLPVMVSDIPVLRETAGEAALFFNPCDCVAMSEVMKRIVTDQALRQDLIEKGQERVKNFSWEKCARQTWEEIKNV